MKMHSLKEPSTRDKRTIEFPVKIPSSFLLLNNSLLHNKSVWSKPYNYITVMVIKETAI